MRFSGGVEGLAHCGAVVTIAAGVWGLFPEIIQQELAPAGVRLGKIHHPPEFHEHHGALLFIARHFTETTQANEVARPTEQERVTRLSIAAGATCFLVIPFEVFRQIRMDHKPNVALVNAHAKRDGRHNDGHFVLDEGRLALLAFGRRQPSVIGRGWVAVFTQGVGQRFRSTATEAINDARIALALRQEAEQMGQPIPLRHDGVVDVGPVKAVDECPGRSQLKLRQDVLPRQFIGSRCQGHHRDVGKALLEVPQLQVVRPEIMPPLGHAMRFVNGDQVDPNPVQPPNQSLPR